MSRVSLPPTGSAEQRGGLQACRRRGGLASRAPKERPQGTALGRASGWVWRAPLGGGARQAGRGAARPVSAGSAPHDPACSPALPSPRSKHPWLCGCDRGGTSLLLRGGRCPTPPALPGPRARARPQLEGPRWGGRARAVCAGAAPQPRRAQA